jgi:hypothetical protein
MSDIHSPATKPPVITKEYKLRWYHYGIGLLAIALVYIIMAAQILAAATPFFWALNLAELGAYDGYLGLTSALALSGILGLAIYKSPFWLSNAARDKEVRDATALYIHRLRTDIYHKQAACTRWKRKARILHRTAKVYNDWRRERMAAISKQIDEANAARANGTANPNDQLAPGEENLK